MDQSSILLEQSGGSDFNASHQIVLVGRGGSPAFPGFQLFSARQRQRQDPQNRNEVAPRRMIIGHPKPFMDWLAGTQALVSRRNSLAFKCWVHLSARFPRRLQFAVPRGVDLLLMPGEHVLRRDVADMVKKRHRQTAFFNNSLRFGAR